MAWCKIYLTLSALIACHVNANYESLKTLSQMVDISQVPWNSHYDIYESASSKVLPRYYDSYESSLDGSGDHLGSSSEHLPIPGFKKILRQENKDKISKKPTIPFYFVKEDSFKHKEFVPLSAIAHCREVKVKSIEGEPRESVTTCYKCKDPKTKTTYERCSYNGHPKRSASASTNVERFLTAPISFRYRRSNLGEEIARDDYGDYYGKPRNPYRFTEEYFIDATHDVPAAYENKGEVCDKVVKDSMVCMVCKDAKTNGKYEQCSYVKPREKAYSYIKSSSFGKPQEQKDDSADQPEETSYPESFNFDASDRQKDRNPTVVEESRSGYRYPSEDHSNRASTKETKESDEQVQDDATSADCKKIQKDSKTCMICKDSKTGGTYEKCTYNYQPNEKLYKYSKSKNFGYPDKTSDSNLSHETAETSDKSTDYPQSSDSKHDYFDTGKLEVSTYPRRSDRLGEAKVASDDSDSTSHDSAERSNTNDYSGRSSNIEYPISSSNTNSESNTKSYEETIPSKSASEDNSEDTNVDHCKKIQKDSMTCTVCKDPKTGNDFERCSYSYQPSDKLFSYSKSTSFGNSQRDRSHEAPHQDEETDSSETAKGSYGYIPGQTYEASTADKRTSTDDDTEDSKGKKEVDIGYLNTERKKAEIEEFMQNFGKEDRSKCKKIIRDKMTCYQCVDEDGFQKEECVFVTGRKPDKAELAFHESVKQFQIDPAASSARRVDPSTPTNVRTADPLEPNASASGNSYVKLEKPDNEYPEEAPQAAEETKEAEPYDYTSETRPRYDKVLGFTLPAYMFTTSEHEAAFDEIVASSHDQR